MAKPEKGHTLRGIQNGYTSDTYFHKQCQQLLDEKCPPGFNKKTKLDLKGPWEYLNKSEQIYKRVAFKIKQI